MGSLFDVIGFNLSAIVWVDFQGLPPQKSVRNSIKKALLFGRAFSIE